MDPIPCPPHRSRPGNAYRQAPLLLLGLLLLGLASAADAQQRPFPNPTVRALPFATPVGGSDRNYPFFSQADWLKPFGYVEEEFIIEGTANRYDTQAGTITDGGHPYRTRLLVRRPADPAKFNGTVLLEWQNVTAQYDLDALWSPVRQHLVENGYAWVGVSAQRVGVDSLKAWSPARYGSLDVTVGGTIRDDALSYDIFGQAARAIRSPQGVNPMGNLQVREVIGKGASQSASRLTPFYNAVQPLHEPVIDLLYLAVGGGETRTDQRIPVFRILSETDVLTVAARGAEVQPDSDRHRRWEVAGTSHSGYAGFLGRLEVAERDHGAWPGMPSCAQPPYSRVPLQNAMQAAYGHMVRWVREGVAPPTAPLLARTGSGLARDEDGLAGGGVQLPEHAAPIALNAGGNTGDGFCRLYGTHQPFEAATLLRRYRDHRDYVTQTRVAAERAVQAGHLLPEDAERSIDAAKRFEFPRR
jgi:hypothetical protein